jgi:hypothetical protein
LNEFFLIFSRDSVCSVFVAVIGGTSSDSGLRVKVILFSVGGFVFDLGKVKLESFVLVFFIEGAVSCS